MVSVRVPVPATRTCRLTSTPHDDWASSSHDDSASAAVLYLGLHSPAAHRHDLHAYAYLQPAARLEQMADVALQSLGWVAGSYAAAHVAERADDVDDCGLTYLEQRPPKAKEFVACGNHTSRIGPRTHALLLAQQLLHVPAAAQQTAAARRAQPGPLPARRPAL